MCAAQITSLLTISLGIFRPFAHTMASSGGITLEDDYGEAIVAVIEPRGADDRTGRGAGCTERPAGRSGRDGHEQRAIHPVHGNRLAGDGRAECRPGSGLAAGRPDELYPDD